MRCGCMDPRVKPEDDGRGTGWGGVLLRAIAMPCRYSVNSFATTGLHDRFSPLESVAVSILMTKAITTKTTGFGGAVSGVRKV